jgi:DNA helicase-2/ATP-dependent DNA helicase PcrA
MVSTLKNSTAFTPSVQQAGVFEWARNKKGNAFIQAVAGAGKTTTLIELCKIISGSVAFLAFNKKIATEIEAKVSAANLGHVTAKTFHALGFQFWRKIHRYVKVDGWGKRKAIIENVGIPKDLEGFVFTLLSHAKNQAIGLFGDFSDTARYYEIIEKHNLTETLENPELVSDGVNLTIKALYASNAMASSLIDFDDMLYCPLVAGVQFETFDWILVDEAQDTNPARRAFVRRLMDEDSRVVFVGDRHQAIYGFAGADSDSVDQIISEYNAAELPLTVTYRCPKAVVKASQAYVSHIQAHETAPEGSVKALGKYEDVFTAGLTAKDAILCRNTKPIVELAYSLLRKNIPCYVEGKDIGQGLKKFAEKYKVKTVDAMRDRLETYVEREKAKLIAKGKETAAEALQDKFDTLLIIAEGCRTVDEVKGKIDLLFQDSDDPKKPRNAVTLSTVHKSKGREWPRVFLLGQEKYMPSKYARQAWQLEQEMNLIYVAYTRAMSELIFVPAS